MAERSQYYRSDRVETIQSPLQMTKRECSNFEIQKMSRV